MRRPSTGEMLTGLGFIAGAAAVAAGRLALRVRDAGRQETAGRDAPIVDDFAWSTVPYSQLHIATGCATLPRPLTHTDPDCYAVFETTYQSPAMHAVASELPPLGRPIVVRKIGGNGAHHYEKGESGALADALAEASAQPDWNGNMRFAIPLGRTSMMVCLTEQGADGALHGKPTTHLGNAPYEQLLDSAAYPGLVIARPTPTPAA
jgi:hypothetical protein